MLALQSKEYNENMKKLPKSLTRVTTVSKIIALILFITLPFIGFWLGMIYQAGIDAPMIIK